MARNQSVGTPVIAVPVVRVSGSIEVKFLRSHENMPVRNDNFDEIEFDFEIKSMDADPEPEPPVSNSDSSSPHASEQSVFHSDESITDDAFHNTDELRGVPEPRFESEEANPCSRGLMQNARKRELV